MNKQEALKKLNTLEVEIKNLRAIIDAPEDIREKIKTYADACKHLGEDSNKIPFNCPQSNEEEAINANWMMWRITRALNDGWEPNWDDKDELKYYPWFNMENAVVGFSYSDYWYTGTTVGSRLCFKSRELAEYAGNQFKHIYEKLMVLPQQNTCK